MHGPPTLSPLAPSSHPRPRQRPGRRQHPTAREDETTPIVIVLRTTCQRDPDLLEQLAQCGLRACVVPDGAQVFAVVRSLAPAVVLLDLRHGDAGALAACPQLKRIAQVHVIVLAERTQTDACTLGLELVADDFLARPASPREIAARIRAIVRRSAHPSAGAGEGLVLDELRYCATLDGRTLPLTPAEFRLLAMLAAARNRVLSRRQVLEAMHVGESASERSVDSLVHHLRRKLARVRPGQKVIRATYGAGYSLHI